VFCKLARLHIEYPEAEHKQLKLIALAKGVTASSLARSYIQRGIDHDLISTTTRVGKPANHLPQLEAYTPALNFQEQQVQTSIQISPSPEYPKPRSNYELNKWHKRFFSECFLETRMRFFDNPSGTVYDPSLLMAVVSKTRLVNCMLERGKDLKLFRVHGAIVEVIINRMINQKIIANTRGDLLAAPMILLEKIVKTSDLVSEHSTDEVTTHNVQGNTLETNIVGKEDNNSVITEAGN
jgi:hypothetical protein